MTHDQIQWALYGFCVGVFVCGITADLLALVRRWKIRGVDSRS